jgi:hypothetical protein
VIVRPVVVVGVWTVAVLALLARFVVPGGGRSDWVEASADQFR